MPIQQRFRTVLTARLLLEYRDHLLFLAQTKANGGGYTLPGGKIEGAEFAKDALVRETFEEVGVIVKKKNLELVHITHRKLKSVIEIIFLFKASGWTGEMVVKEPEKFREAIWLPYDEAPERLTAVLKYTLTRLAKGYSYSEFPKFKKKEILVETDLKSPKITKKNKTKPKTAKPKNGKKAKPLKKKINKIPPEKPFTENDVN
ncbi:MAG: NUDIX domain-containing protein [Saprospiraceae bacterium]|nr:NUDIX domain-containing protein [Saprospiraceae bacterium]